MPDDTILLPIQVGTVPEGFCQTLGPDWIQQLWNLFGQSVALLNAGSGAGTIILYQETTPSPEQRGFLWYRLSTGLIYHWEGAWISPHPSEPAPGGIERKMFEGTPAEIWSVEGGDGSDPLIVAPSANVGAMWEIDTAYTGRSPMGPGAIVGSNPAKTLALSEDFGEGAHRQTETEMFRHTHGPADGFDDFMGRVSAGEPSSFEITAGTEIENMPLTGETGGNASATNDAANVTHPVHGVYICKRTARKNFVAGP